MDRFRAYRVTPEGRGFAEMGFDELSPGEVLIRNRWSSLNYKDALAVTGRGKILRKLPLNPGIDAAGEVVMSESPEWKQGDLAFTTGAGLGEDIDGGYSEFVRVPSAALVRLPSEISFEQAMGIGTAGFTAMLCVDEFELSPMEPGDGPILVTGAGGGVGTFSTMLLAQKGYHVVAATGRLELAAKLMDLGAKEVIVRADVGTDAAKPLAASRWAGAIDTVGGETLASILRACAPGACVCAVGLVGSPEFSSTVFPFILRGARLIGIDSSHCNSKRRRSIWSTLASTIDPTLLAKAYEVAPLGEVEQHSLRLLEGEIAGRVAFQV